MKNYKSFIAIYILIFILPLQFGCEKDKISNSLEGDNSIRATGSYLLNNVDKEKWGDFLLILELNSSKFDKANPFPFFLAFKNTGNKTITLDGILPYRQSANPPSIDLWINDSTRYQIDSILDKLLNDNNITIDPGQQVTLIQGDLTQIDGTLFHLDSTGISYDVEEVDNLSSKLKTGLYKIQGHFHPTPQIYFSDTDTITIKVE